jgi:hypothetical protein
MGARDQALRRPPSNFPTTPREHRDGLRVPRAGLEAFGVRDFYTRRAAECLLASQQVHKSADKRALLHLAATYLGLIEERHQEGSEYRSRSQDPQISS